jgi:hypothetical protein
MDSESRMNRMPMLSAALALLAILLSIPVISAHVLPEGVNCLNVVCPVANRPECTCDYMTCHYWCEVTAKDIVIDPSTGKLNASTLISGRENLDYLMNLKAGTAQVADTGGGIEKREQSLSNYYDQVLSTEPKNFWGNYDYAALKMMQGDYSAADQMYYTAISTLDPATKIEMLDTMRIANREKLKMSEQTLTDKTSSFLSKMGSDLKDAVSDRYDAMKEKVVGNKIAVPQPEDYNNEKLTILGKWLGQKTGVCSGPAECNKCVSDPSSYGKCVVNGLTGVSNQ